MKQTKRTWNFYTAWNWQQELDDLNARSAQGWQLTHGGLFSSKFKYQPDVQYRYQLDYPGKIDEMPRYLETFRDQGWEFVNHSGNGWYYFRKVYDPKADPEEYEINTDRTSLRQMTGRWVKLAGGIAAGIGLWLLLVLFLFLRQPQWPYVLILAEMVLIMLMLVRGILQIRRKDVKKVIRHDALKFFLLILLYTGCLIGFFVLAGNRPHIQVMHQGYYIHENPEDEQTVTGWLAFDVKYRDNYYLNLDVEAEHPITLWLEDEKGAVFYTVTGHAVHEDGLKLRLSRGSYEVKIAYEQEGEQKVEMELH